MQENETEQRTSRKAMRAYGLSMTHETVILPLLSEVENAIRQKRPVSFEDYVRSASPKIPNGTRSEKAIAKRAVRDLRKTIAFHRNFLLWSGEQKEHEKIIADYKPNGRLAAISDKIIGNYKIENATGRIKTIEGYRKERKHSVERMTAACKYIEKMHLR